mgnify:CR=1 FL=1
MTHEELIKAIEEMSVLELSELVKALEEKFGVSASAAPVAMMAMPGAAAGAAYVVWRRSQPVEDPWAEEYWADSAEDEAGSAVQAE